MSLVSCLGEACEGLCIVVNYLLVRCVQDHNDKMEPGSNSYTVVPASTVCVPYVARCDVLPGGHCKFYVHALLAQSAHHKSTVEPTELVLNPCLGLLTSKPST
jgi:hypothetical protein